jgi:hypothetical protein
MPPQAGWDTKLTLANSELEEVCVPSVSKKANETGTRWESSLASRGWD